MQIYLSIGEIQDFILEYLSLMKQSPDFVTVISGLIEQNRYSTEPPCRCGPADFIHMDDGAFLHAVRSLYYPVNYEAFFSDAEYDFVDASSDIATISQFYGLAESMHTHDCFEINYVFEGKCELIFLDEVRTLKRGDFCILSPYARHLTRLLTQNSHVFPVYVKEKTFEQAFFPLLSGSDILSDFFRWILSNRDKPNYLLFHTSDSGEMRHIVKQLFVERFHLDPYCNRCQIALLNLLFANVLRTYERYSRFSSYEAAPDYAPILRYIQSHYRTVTLRQLSDRYNYTVPYLSRLIRRITGSTFSGIICRLKMEEAKTLLITSKDSIEKISELTGYNSADHFSRCFRNYYGISPLKYRKEHS